MDFAAIVDVKVRNAAGCAVAGVYEDGDLGIAARQIDAQVGGLIGKLHAGGDFADGVIAYEGKWLGGETFVSFDKNAFPVAVVLGNKAKLLS